MLYNKKHYSNSLKLVIISLLVDSETESLKDSGTVWIHCQDQRLKLHLALKSFSEALKRAFSFYFHSMPYIYTITKTFKSTDSDLILCSILF